MKPQPGRKGMHQDGDTWIVRVDKIFWDGTTPIAVKPPYPVGALLAGKEAYKEHGPAGRCAATPAIYRADYSFELVSKALGPWQPASRMPAEYIRLHLRVEANRCERGDVWEWVTTVERREDGKV